MFRHSKREREKSCVERLGQLVPNAGRMYWLALVLTDDENLAASLTQENIEQLMNDNPVFVRWIERWGQRMVIKACIAAKQAALKADQCNSDSWDAAAAEIEIGNAKPLHELSIDSIQRSARSLPVLPRFLLVMNVLEGYSLHDAAQLLQVSRSTCAAACRYACAALAHAIHCRELSSWVEGHSFAQNDFDSYDNTNQLGGQPG